MAASQLVSMDSDPGISQAGLTPQELKTVGVGNVGSRGLGSNLFRGKPLYIQHEPTDHASYVLSFSVAATAALDVFSLYAAASTSFKVVRLRRIVLVNPGSATAATVVDLQLGTAGTIGSGGAATAPTFVDRDGRQLGTTGGPDAAVPLGTYRTGDTTQATGYLAAYNPLVSVSVPTTAAGFTPQTIYDARDPQFKPLTVGQSNLIVLRCPAIGAGATGLRGYAEFTVDDA